MKRIFEKVIFDIETDGLLDTGTKIHSLVIMDNETKKLVSCHVGGKCSIEYGLTVLEGAGTVIGHNIIAYDLPMIKKLYPDWTTQATAHDTLVMSRLYYPDVKDIDFGLLRKGKNFPKKLIGSHSLEAWGYRIGEYKDEFGKTTDWKEWSPEMQSYCEQDVAVTLKLYHRLMKTTEEWGNDSFDLEHQFAVIIADQIQYGFAFNEGKAAKLYAELSGRRTVLVDKLKEIFPPVDKGGMFTPKANNKTRGYVKGVPVWKPKMVEFNPSSRDHIAERLIKKYDWKPTVFTDMGKPQIDETVLKGLTFAECPKLIEYLTVEKRIGQIAEGAQAWLRSIGSDGRIHGSVTTNGAVTGRCTHHHPNVAQVPAVGAPYGEECRSLFGPPKGYYQLGCDAAGLELRCLAHFITKYDGGTYRDIILHGDIHTANQKAAGLATRAEAKRFIYAFLYGAGDVLIGSLLKPDATEQEQAITGKKVKRQFLNQTPALKRLIETVKRTAKERKFLRGLDGRHLSVRSEHSALNLLLQSAGALVMKKATVILWQDLESMGFTFGSEVAQMAHIHDEYQLAVREDISPDLIGPVATAAIRKAGEYFNFRCPLDGEYKTGRNWAETH